MIPLKHLFLGFYSSCKREVTYIKGQSRAGEVGKGSLKATSSSHWPPSANEPYPPLFYYLVTSWENVSKIHCVLYVLYTLLSCKLKVLHSNKESTLSKVIIILFLIVLENLLSVWSLQHKFYWLNYRCSTPVKQGLFPGARKRRSGKMTGFGAFQRGSVAWVSHSS